MKLYDTLSRTEKEVTLQDGHDSLSFYTCGPTVYDETHIGHMRKYTMDDVLRRTFEHEGFTVRHVMNITDVGHLTGDDDSGDDKLEKGAKKQGKTVYEVAQYYTDKFFETMDAIGVQRPSVVMKATDHIAEMIALIKTLDEKGFVYQTAEAVYFDVTKFGTYGRLSGQNLEDKKQGARDDVNIDKEKKHPADFALWFKRVGRFADHMMHWESPWGDGFPGWHIECSAMSMKELGETVDIHTGGIDHIPVHHENEIAQSEGATGREFVRYWVHHAFLQVEGEKMSKSKGNFYTLKDIQDRGIDPMAVRYLFLQTHYRKPLNFTWEAAKEASDAYNRLKNIAVNLRIEANYPTKKYIFNETSIENIRKSYIDKFHMAISEDLNSADALGVMWDMLRSTVPPKEKVHLLALSDKVFGLKLLPQDIYDKPFKAVQIEKHISDTNFPDNIRNLARMRLDAKKNKDFALADQIRDKLKSEGYSIDDIAMGYKIIKGKKWELILDITQK